jgi:hypothetical protein
LWAGVSLLGGCFWSSWKDYLSQVVENSSAENWIKEAISICLNGEK